MIENRILWEEIYFFLLVFFFFFLFFFLFRAKLKAYGSFQPRGWIGAVAAGLPHSHSNAGSLTHWVKPGLEPTSSWILAGFITAEPQQDSKKQFTLLIPNIRYSECANYVATMNATLHCLLERNYKFRSSIFYVFYNTGLIKSRLTK